MRFARVISCAVGASIATVTGCQSGPPAPPPAAAPLEIKPMPSGAALPVAAPPPPANRTATSHGKCGKAEAGVAAPPTHALPLTADHVTVVLFWATWCGPCGKQFPEYQKLFEKNRDRGLDVVAISVDDEATGIKQYAKDHGARFTIGWDDGHADAECWKISTMPTTYVVDRNGVVRFVHDGYHDGETAKLQQEVESLL